MKVQKRIFLVLLCMGLTFLLTGCTGKKSQIVTGKQIPMSVSATEQNAVNQTEVTGNKQAVVGDTKIYEVMAVDTTTSIIKFYNINKAKQESFTYNDGTFFLDKYGDYTSVSKMVPGKMVLIQISDKTKELAKVQITDKAWEYDDVKNFTIDQSKNMITIAGTKYYYKSDLNVFSEDNIVGLGNIGDKDVLRVQGIGKQIYTVSVTSGHGVIQLSNTSMFEGGWLSLNTKMYLQITNNMQLEVAEGTYQLSVANDGYGDTKEITVNRGQVTTVDLNQYKGAGPQYCNITFQVGVEKAVMTIDGGIVDYTKPLSVKYGIHNLEIVANGYDTWSKKLYVNSKEATIQVAMTEESTEKTSTESKKNSTTSQGTTSKSGTTTTPQVVTPTTPSVSTPTVQTPGTTTKNTGSTSGTTSGTTSGSTADSSYLNTLSNIISTLTNSSSKKDNSSKSD
jgi:hypothetical protein